VNGTGDNGSTPDGAPDRQLSKTELGQLYEAVSSFIEGMATAKAAWDAAPTDDHAAEQWNQWEAVGIQLEHLFQLIDRLDKLLGNLLDRDGAMHLAALERPLRTLRDQLIDLHDRKVGPLLKPASRGKGRVRDTPIDWKQRAIVAAMNKALLSMGRYDKAGAGNYVAGRLAKAGRPLPTNIVREKSKGGDKTPGWRVVDRWTTEMTSHAYAYRDAPETKLYRDLVDRAEAVKQEAIKEERDLKEIMQRFVRVILEEYP
jgi:hypothetical protein